MEDASVFCWYEKEVDIKGVAAVDFSASSKTELMEAAFQKQDGELAKVKTASALFDEQTLVPDSYSFKNSTYFDEIYHARTAYEFIKGREVYEWTHPPLGKSIIALGIRIFGMNPFGWRFMGTLFGVLMLPLMYIFAKKNYINNALASASLAANTLSTSAIATALLTLDITVERSRLTASAIY